jgi:hypothetical protein
VKIELNGQHKGHTPGDDEDIRTVPLADEQVQQIEENLTVPYDFRQVTIDALHQMEGREACSRRPH